MSVPFACVFLAFLLVYFPRLLVMAALRRQHGRMDNKHPRDQQAKLEGWGRRANAAHANAFESFAPFAAAVFVAHLGGADPRRTAGLAITYVVLRVLYTLLYVANKDALRSTAWLTSFAVIVCLFCLPLVR